MLDVQITPQAWKHDPGVIIKHDDLYARAWEREYERPIFDNNHDIAVKTISPKFVIQYDGADNEISTIRGTI